MVRYKRRRKDDNPSGDNTADSDSEGSIDTDAVPPCILPSVLLSADDIEALNNDISVNCKDFIQLLGTEKDQGRRSKMNSALSAVCDAFRAVSNAYLFKLGMDSIAKACTDNIVKACKRMHETCDSLASQASNLNTQQPSSQAPCQSYASISRNTNTASRKIMLDQGKPIAIVRAKRVIVNPSENVKAKFPDSQATRAALCRAVNPAALQLRVKRLIPSKDSPSVIVEGDSLEPLLCSKALKDVGLEATSDMKLDPRVVIHGIPVDYSKEEIESFVSQNFPTISPNRFKVVYVYPAGNKKFRSCVIQMDTELRELFFQQDRISIGWHLCRFADHISILQCYNCLQFGHKSADCVNVVACGNCSQAHPTSQCKNNKQLRCANCKRENLSDSHSAFDKSKCPSLRKKIERKASRINYG